LPTTTAAIEQGFPLKVVGEPLFLEPLSLAIDKGDAEWGARLAEVIAEMHADGTLSKLSQKWYKADLTAN
jgi:polar amino acid transport system substrate-binding protein